MNHSSTSCAKTSRSAREQVERGRWIVGLLVTLVVVAAFVAAVAYAPASIRANNALCLQQLANEEHTSLEAFFQNPVEQDALVQAVAVCAR
ncbi:hypothetical protein [Paraburkholderia sp. BCC1884]|uniref:hypothetical protein n=1 Tax=Paraburkholderia sp. BCC1884 TaxID=2562668 RepID=UPI001181F0A8|nr:hypothetical protein [Paraburkholderia sp. BCC1884]